MKFDRINVNRLDDIGYVIDKEKFLKFVNDFRIIGVHWSQPTNISASYFLRLLQDGSKARARGFGKQSYIEKLSAEKNRIENNVINSYLIYSIVQQLDKKIDNYFYNNVNIKYDSASYFYNDAIYKLNRFIDYRNKQFQPDRGDSYLIKMLDSVKQSFNLSLYYLDSIDRSYALKNALIDHLYKSINAALINYNEQAEFLDKILNTSKNYRKSLFYE